MNSCLLYCTPDPFWKGAVPFLFKQTSLQKVVTFFYLQFLRVASLKNVSTPLKSTLFHYCRLLCHLLVILKVIFANSVDLDQTAPLEAV